MTAPMGPILVIKHGALGDLVQALGPLAAIRRHHPGQRVVLLTTPPFAGLFRSCPFVDEVWTDERPALWRLDRVRALRRRLRAPDFAMVYDLQTSSRSSAYYRLMGRPRPRWSGIAPGCSHPHADPSRNALHTLDRQRAQLACAGIHDVPSPDLGWATADVSGFRLPPRYAVLAPGTAPHRPDKRWPPVRFGVLARRLADGGAIPVLVGTGGDAAAIDDVAAAYPGSINLCARTSLAELATILRGAKVAVGNDSGPMHMAAVVGCPTVVLFARASDPALTAPRGAHVRVVRASTMTEISVDAVAAALPSDA